MDNDRIFELCKERSGMNTFLKFLSMEKLLGDLITLKKCKNQVNY